LIKASHSGKVVCPVEAKWIFVQDQILSILFSERASVGPQSRIEKQLIEALETLQKAARNELEPNDPPRCRKVRRNGKP